MAPGRPEDFSHTAPGEHGERNQQSIVVGDELTVAVSGRNGRFPQRRFTPNKAAVTKFTACVKQHGYNLPAPNFSGKGPIFPRNIETNAKFQAAAKSCQHLLIPARPGGGSSSGTSTTSGA